MEEKEIQIQELREGLARRKWTILTTTILIVMVISVFTYIQPPKYISTSVMMLETVNVAMPSLSSNKGSNATPTKPIGFYQAILQSKTLKRILMQRASEDSLLMSRVADLKLSLNELVTAHITLTTPNDLNFIEIRVETPDPDLSYRLADLATQHLKTESQRIDEEQARNEISYLESHLGATRKKLELAEQALQEFREKSNITFSDENDGLLKRLITLENELMATQTQKELALSNLSSYYERLNRQFSQEKHNEFFENPAIKNLNQELLRLQERHDQATSGTSEEIRLQDKIKEKGKQIVKEMLALRNNADPVANSSTNVIVGLDQKIAEEEIQLYVLKNKEDYFQKAIAEFRKKNPNLLDNALEMDRLMRERKVLESLYATFIEKNEESKIRAATGTGGIRIIDPATLPEFPTDAGWLQILILAAFGGCIVGISIAFVQEMLDQTVKSAEVITDRLQLSLIGMIPTFIEEKKKPKGDLLDLNHKDVGLVYGLRTRSPITEAFRALRTNLQYSTADDRLQVIQITSAAPKDGKSFVAANLGAAFAESGKKVLIVDADLRKPKQHRIFGLQKDPGLTNLVVRSLQLDEVIATTPVHGLDFMASGALPPNPAEIIGSRTMGQVFEMLRERYDYIIVDTPPVSAVADPLVTSQLVDGVVFVVRHEETNKNMAHACVDRLRQVKGKLIGGVMNSASVRPGYSYYNYYNYTYSYFTPTEKKNGVSEKVKSSISH